MERLGCENRNCCYDRGGVPARQSRIGEQPPQPPEPPEPPELAGCYGSMIVIRTNRTVDINACLLYIVNNCIDNIYLPVSSEAITSCIIKNWD